MECLFDEPWIGQCKNPAKGKPIDFDNYEGMCCEKHAAEKCVVCGQQAFTRCQASIGVMCGRPLCDICGKGEMCDHHCSRGPVKVIVDLRAELEALKKAGLPCTAGGGS